MNLVSEQIYCINHNRKQIKLDPNSFQIACLACQKEGKNGNENLKISNEKEHKKKEYFCYKNPAVEALFYCDDCSVFVGTKCFALEHRKCNCSIPELMHESLGKDMTKLIKDLTVLKEQVDNNIEKASELDNFFNQKNTQFKNSINSFEQEINSEMSKKSKSLKEEIENIFNGIDVEIENSSQRLNLTKKRANKILEETKEICLNANQIKSDEQMCIYKKQKEPTLQENKKFLNDMQLFMAENLTNTKRKTEAGMEEFLKKCDEFQKNSEIYENSVINTINSGIPNKCMRIRRFRRYFFTNSRYLKTTSISFRVSESISIVGFCLTGLFNNNKSTNPSFDFNVKIFELNVDQDFNSTEKKNLLWESKINVPTISNVVDPVFQFYLNKGIRVNKEKNYVMIMNNLEKNSYIDMWTGEIIPEKSDLIETQNVTCNNSGVKFCFFRSNGVQSDFDEFSNGIVSDVIFSHLD